MPIMRKMNLINVHFWTYLSFCCIVNSYVMFFTFLCLSVFEALWTSSTEIRAHSHVFTTSFYLETDQ